MVLRNIQRQLYSDHYISRHTSLNDSLFVFLKDTTRFNTSGELCWTGTQKEIKATTWTCSCFNPWSLRFSDLLHTCFLKVCFLPKSLQGQSASMLAFIYILFISIFILLLRSSKPCPHNNLSKVVCLFTSLIWANLIRIKL